MIAPQAEAAALSGHVSQTPPVINERGETLVAILRDGDIHPAATDPVFALALARHGDRVLLVRNIARGVWELPGGWADHGESPESCALRELVEESGQSGHNPHLLVRLVLRRDHVDGAQNSTGTLHAIEIRQVTPFTATDEVSAIGWWQATELPDDTSAIDAALIAAFAD